MPNPFQQAGAQPTKPSQYAPIFINRFFTGFWSQRNPLREAAVPLIYEKFYGGNRNDSLIGGLNVELSNELTLVRSPGSSIYNNQVFPPIQSFYSFRTSTSSTETIQVLADTTNTIYDATGANTKTTILTKALGAGAAYFQAVGQTLFICDGAETKKYRQNMGSTGGVLPNWGIAAPTTAPQNQPLAYAGAPCRYWAPNLTLQSGYTVIDANGNVELMTGNQNTSATSSTTIAPTTLSNGAFPANFPFTPTGGVTIEGFDNPSLAYDGDPNTGATKSYTNTHKYAVCVYSFSYSGDTPVSLVLNALSEELNTKESGLDSGQSGIWYSLDNSTTWTALWNDTTGRSRPKQWDTPATPIPANTNINQIQICIFLDAHDHRGLSVFELNLVVGTVTISAPTATTLTTGVTTPKWATALYALTVDGQAIWQNQGEIGAWQALTVFSGTGPTGAIIDVNGNLQVVQKAGTTGATDPGTGTLVLTSVAVGGGNAVYAYSSFTGITPAIGLRATFSGFGTSGNNVSGVLTAVNPGVSVTVATTTQVNETHAGVAQIGWATVAGDTTTDGTVVWLCCGPGQIMAFSGYQHAYSFHCSDGHVSTASPITFSTGPILGSLLIPLSGQGSPDTQCDQIWIWRTFDGGSTLFLDDQYGAGTLSISAVSVPTTGTLTFTSVAVAAGNAVYAYSASSGVAPTVGQMVVIAGFVTAGNNVTAPITAVNPGVSITLATTTQVNETHAGSGNLTGSTATYTYKLISGALPHVGQTSTITLLTDAGNNGAFVIDTVDWIASTFTVTNASAVAASGQAGTAVTPSPGSGTWSLKDSAADTDLDEFILAPTAHANDPPPIDFAVPAYHVGRIFGAVGNIVYYSGGPDTVTGDGNQAFPPLNFFQVPSLVRRLVPYALGLLVFTVSDVYLIQGAGTLNSPLFTIPYILGVGLESYWELAINGALIYFKSSDGQVVSLNPSAGLEQIGFPIGDKFKVGGGFN